jgi:hypothetical protein
LRQPRLPQIVPQDIRLSSGLPAWREAQSATARESFFFNIGVTRGCGSFRLFRDLGQIAGLVVLKI